MTEENFTWHSGHCSTCPLLAVKPLLLLLLLLWPVWNAWLNSLLNFEIPASAEARTDEAALIKVEAHLGEDVAGALLGFDTSFLLLLKKLVNWKAVSGFLGPGQL